MNPTRPLHAAALALALATTTISCAAVGDGADDEAVGRVQLALVTPPSDALCLRLTTESAATGLKVVKLIGLTANVMNSSQVANLPTGTVTMLGEVFGVACASVTATTGMTWVSDKQTVAIPLDEVPTVTLTLRRAAKVNVGVDFALAATFEDIKLPAIPVRFAAAPDNSVVMTFKASNWLYRASTPFNVAKITSTSGTPKYVTVASDGSILTTLTASPTSTTGTFASFTAVGVAKTTFPIGFQAADLLLDPVGSAWIGSAATGQVLRIATALTTPTGLTITLAGSTTAPGLALAPDGTLRVAGAPGQLNSLKADGTNLGAVIPLGMVPRDATIAADGTAYVQALTGAQVVTVSPAGVAQGFWAAGPTNLPDAAIVTTSKGILFADPTGVLVLADPVNGISTFIVPDFSVVNTLAVLPNGKIWAGDSARPRAWIVTLP